MTLKKTTVSRQQKREFDMGNCLSRETESYLDIKERDEAIMSEYEVDRNINLVLLKDSKGGDVAVFEKIVEGHVTTLKYVSSPEFDDTIYRGCINIRPIITEMCSNQKVDRGDIVMIFKLNNKVHIRTCKNLSHMCWMAGSLGMSPIHGLEYSHDWIITICPKQYMQSSSL